MQVDTKKLERQLEGVARWQYSASYGAPTNGCGTLWYEMGVGKTYTGLIVMRRVLDHNPVARVIVLVPSEVIQRHWKKGITEHIPPEQQPYIDVITIHYAVTNNMMYQCDLLVVDEVHEFYTPERVPYVTGGKIFRKFILCLTGTWEDKEHRERYIRPYCPVVDRITEQEALREGFISKYIEYNLACSFTEQEAMEYKAYSELIQKHLPKFGGVLELAQKCLVGGVHSEDGNKYTGIAFSTGWAMRNGWRANGNLDDEEYQRVNDLWNPNKVIGYAKTLMMAIRERKNIIYNVADKAYKATQVVLRHDTLKTICFSQSTAFADALGRMINQASPDTCVIYHSKLETITRQQGDKIKKVGKTILKREAEEKIRNGTARVISTVSSFDRGVDIVDLRMAITSSGTQNYNQHKQRNSRAKRIELYAPDHVTLIVNLYVPGTVDEKWLRKRQSKSTNIVHWVTNVDEINFVHVVSTSIDSQIF